MNKSDDIQNSDLGNWWYHGLIWEIEEWFWRESGHVPFGLCCIEVEHPSEDSVDSWLYTCPKLRREVITVNMDIFQIISR